MKVESYKQLLEQKGLTKLNYFIMGQVCIAKGYRGQGVFRELYSFLKLELSKDLEDIFDDIYNKH